MGDNVVLGDTRWAGLYGIEADFVADENCKIKLHGGRPVGILHYYCIYFVAIIIILIITLS